MRLLRARDDVACDGLPEGGRVALRRPRDGDWRAYAEVRGRSRAFLEPWEPAWPDDALTRASYRRRLRRYAAEWRNDSGYNLFVFRRGTGALLGGISLSNLRRGIVQSATLGYWIGEPHARQGYMSEAVLLTLGFCFGRLALHRVEASCMPANEASRRLLLRCGFSEEGFARSYLRINGNWHDHVLFGCLGPDVRTARRGGGG